MKKIVALLLVLSVVLCAGCNQEEKSSKKSESAATQTDVQQTQQPEQTGVAFDPDFHCDMFAGDGYLETGCYTPGVLTVYYEEYMAEEVVWLEEDVAVSDIANGQVCFSFTDSFDNTGKMTLVFLKDGIQVTIAVESRNPSAIACVTEGTQMYVPMEGEGDDYDDEEPDEPDAPSGLDGVPTIAVGDMYFDDVAGLLPVSMEQIRKDMQDNKVNWFYVGNQKVPFETAHLMPIKGGYTHRTRQDEYQIDLHGYFTNGSVTYDFRFYMKYKLYDVGGWVFSTWGEEKKLELTGSVAQPFCPGGEKVGNFRYDDYPSRLDISMGELADDILYADLNYVRIKDKCTRFDLESIEIVMGDYWSNEYGDYLRLHVNIGFTNDTHTGYAIIPLEYKYYAAGGWELVSNYYDEKGIQAKFPVDEIEFQPKQVDYSDSAFVKAARDYFTDLRYVSAQDGMDDDGYTTRTIVYDGKRELDYLTEYYRVTLEATFFNERWQEKVEVHLVGADHSRLLGVWEYRVGDEYIRVRIKDIQFAVNGEDWNINYSVGTITCQYESSGWGGEAYIGEEIVNELRIGQNVLYYAQKNAWYYMHNDVISYVSGDAGKHDAQPHDVSIDITGDGLIVTGSAWKNDSIPEGAVLTKVG